MRRENVKRKVTVVLLVLAAVGSQLVIASPAQASVGGCTPNEVLVNNSGGRLMGRTCWRHVAGGYGVHWEGTCYKSGTYEYKPCNVAVPYFVVGRRSNGSSDYLDSGTFHASGLDTGQFDFNFNSTGHCAAENGEPAYAATIDQQVRFNVGGTLFTATMNNPQTSGNFTANISC
jgi:hypothetical protein